MNETTTIASVDHACGDILVGDFLEPFQMPDAADGDITAVDTTREPDFTSISKVLYGSEERRSGGAGEFMLIERGMNQDVAARRRTTRSTAISRCPARRSASIGEATVVSVGPTMALIRINRARDAVFSGDLAVPRK